MEAPNFIEDLVDRDRAGGTGPNRHRDRYDFFAQPALDRGVPLLQGAQASTYHFAARSSTSSAHWFKLFPESSAASAALR